MTASELIKAVMKEKGYSNQKLASDMGYNTASYVSEKLRRKNGLRVDWFVKMLNEMNCEIIVRDTIGNKNQWELTLDTEDEAE